MSDLRKLQVVASLRGLDMMEIVRNPFSRPFKWTQVDTSGMRKWSIDLRMFILKYLGIPNYYFKGKMHF
jgi:hypothetical protein